MVLIGQVRMLNFTCTEPNINSARHPFTLLTRHFALCIFHTTKPHKQSTLQAGDPLKEIKQHCMTIMKQNEDFKTINFFLFQRFFLGNERSGIFLHEQKTSSERNGFNCVFTN